MFNWGYSKSFCFLLTLGYAFSGTQARLPGSGSCSTDSQELEYSDEGRERDQARRLQTRVHTRDSFTREEGGSGSVSLHDHNRVPPGQDQVWGSLRGEDEEAPRAKTQLIGKEKEDGRVGYWDGLAWYLFVSSLV